MGRLYKTIIGIILLSIAISLFLYYGIFYNKIKDKVGDSAEVYFPQYTRIEGINTEGFEDGDVLTLDKNGNFIRNDGKNTDGFLFIVLDSNSVVIYHYK